MAVSIRLLVLWDVTPFSCVDGDLTFERSLWWKSTRTNWCHTPRKLLSYTHTGFSL